MNKVVTANLGGKSYQIEENGFDALELYLDQACTRLSGSPDRDAIMNSFEQTIAQKCDVLLSPEKNVISTREMRGIIAEMGPVDPDLPAAKPLKVKRKLYLIREGAWIAGVCEGLATYFIIDVMIVRLIFVILALITSGAWVIVYVAMMLFIPHADTPEQKAESRGETFLADDYLARLKAAQESSTPTALSYWTGFYKRWFNFTRVGTALFYFFAAIALGLLVIGWFVALYSVVSTGAIFGFVLLPGATKATTCVFLSCIFLLIFLPLQSLAEEAEMHAKGLQYKTGIMEKIGRIFVWAVALYVIFSISYEYYPPIHDSVNAIRPIIPVIDFGNKTVHFTN